MLVDNYMVRMSLKSQLAKKVKYEPVEGNDTISEDIDDEYE